MGCTRNRVVEIAESAVRLYFGRSSPVRTTAAFLLLVRRVSVFLGLESVRTDPNWLVCKGPLSHLGPAVSASGRPGNVEAFTALTLSQLRKIRRTVAARRERIGCSSDTEFVSHVCSFMTLGTVGIFLLIRRLLHTGFSKPAQNELEWFSGRVSVRTCSDRPTPAGIHGQPLLHARENGLGEENSL